MKKPICVILAVLLIAFSATIPAAAEKDQKSDKITYEKKQVTTYLFDEDDPVKLTCLFRSDLPEVPYITPEDFLNQLFTEKVSVKHDGDVFTVTNDLYDMVIDAGKDTVHFDRVEDFCMMNAKPFLDEEKADYLLEEEELTAVGEVKPADLDLGKYGIDIAVSDGKVYLPFVTLNDIFANNYRLVIYLDGELTFWEAMDDDFLQTVHSDQSDDRSQAYIDFVYNELCFTIDYTYGRPSMAPIAESIDEKGFDETLDSYNSTTAAAKNLLKNGKRMDYCMGLLLLDTYFWDGGHTNLSVGYQIAMMEDGLFDFQSSLTDMIGAGIDYSELLEAQSNVLAYELRENTCAAAKNSVYEDFSLVKSWDDADVYETDGTVIFVFDEFKDAVVEPFKWSLDYAAEKHAKRFIIDLSTNSGGSTAVSEYMLSVICGVNGPDEISTITGNVFELTSPIDKNLDGKFDEKDDKVQYDFEYAILTTSCSFSCANLLPCAAQDNGICIVGERSGGGCCNIAVHIFPDGTLYTLSSTSKVIRADGTDNDTGAEPDVSLPGSEDDYENFFDIDKINTGIDEFYQGVTHDATEPADETQSPAATDAANVTICSDSKDSDDSGNEWLFYLLIGVIVSSAVILIIFIILYINDKKKEKKEKAQVPPDINYPL